MIYTEKVQKWLKNALNDPITKILTKNSNLTKTQIETLLIDFLAENLAEKPMKMEEKAKLRLTKAEISRGAFNRTLKQARRNVIRSIYTVLLLGYLGIFDTTKLDPYQELASNLQTYLNTYRKLLPHRKHEESIHVLTMLKEELKKSLENLSKEKTFAET